VQRATDDITRGNGPVARLLNDRQTADDLSALISNLRRSGVLFYKNRPPENPPSPGPASTPTRRGGSGGGGNAPRGE
jgi:hypothetical protein